MCLNLSQSREELLLSALCRSLFFFLSVIRKSESNQGLSLGLIVTDFSGIHSLTSSRYLSVKSSVAFSVEKALLIIESQSVFSIIVLSLVISAFL